MSQDDRTRHRSPLVDDDNLGDWRMQAATTLAKDAPAVYRGGPSHKAGAPIYLTTMTRNKNGTTIGFITPSPVALALNIAIKAASQSIILKDTIKFGNVLTPLGRGEAVSNESISDLYDYFESCMVSVSFSFQALEAFANEQIANRLIGTFKLKRKDKTLDVSSEELQRIATTEEKMSQVLPAILNKESPRGKKAWHQFIKLKRIRDTTIHLKEHEAYNRGNIDRESLFYQFFNQKISDYPRYAFEIIDFFSTPDQLPRWLAKLKEELDTDRQSDTH